MLRERNAQRTKSDVFNQAQDLDPVARNETPPVGLRLDTGRQTPEESVDEILARLEPDARIGER